MRLLLSVFALVALAACTSVPEDATGAEIYSLLCARCHGSDLQGGVGPQLGGPDAPSADQPDEYLATVTARGMGSMPSFSSSLSDEQIELVVGYIREQQTG